jgi:hypothetical protein
MILSKDNKTFKKEFNFYINKLNKVNSKSNIYNKLRDLTSTNKNKSFNNILVICKEQ